MNTETFVIIMTIFFFVCGIGLGWFGNLAYEGITNKKVLNGLWFSSGNYSTVKDKAYSLDDSGQWVCVNIDDRMKYQTIIDTCIHEASHELFARECTSNVTKCMEEIEK